MPQISRINLEGWVAIIGSFIMLIAQIVSITYFMTEMNVTNTRQSEDIADISKKIEKLEPLKEHIAVLESNNSIQLNMLQRIIDQRLGDKLRR
jgi:hypothetical protein